MEVAQTLEFYSPDQPRDDHGRFGEGSDNGTSSYTDPQRNPDLKAALLSWTTSMGEAAHMRIGLEGGWPSAEAKSILSAIDHVGPTINPAYRGMVFGGKVAEVEKRFLPGTEIDIPIGSFSADHEEAEKFAQWERESRIADVNEAGSDTNYSDSYEPPAFTEVFLTAPAGTHGYSIPYEDVLGTPDDFSQEQEIIVHDKFRVASIEHGETDDHYTDGADVRPALWVNLEPIR